VVLRSFARALTGLNVGALVGYLTYLVTGESHWGFFSFAALLGVAYGLVICSASIDLERKVASVFRGYLIGNAAIASIIIAMIAIDLTMDWFEPQTREGMLYFRIASFVVGAFCAAFITFYFVTPRREPV
jgi:hypothetical protein